MVAFSKKTTKKNTTFPTGGILPLPFDHHIGSDFFSINKDVGSSGIRQLTNR